MSRNAHLTLALCAGSMLACQSPTDPNETVDVITSVATPNPTSANGPTGRTYAVPRTNQPDEIREYDWSTTFAIRVTLTDDANRSDVNLELPVRLTSSTVKVQQASGGIVTTPTGSEVEHYEFAIASASSNELPSANSSTDLTFVVWYDLPNAGREALITVTLVFTDDESRTFSETVSVRVAA